MPISLWATPLRSHPVMCRNWGAPLWNASSPSRRLYLLSLGVAELCSLMEDLTSEHRLVTWSRLGWRRDNEVLGCGWEREAGEATVMRPGFSGGPRAAGPAGPPRAGGDLHTPTGQCGRGGNKHTASYGARAEGGHSLDASTWRWLWKSWLARSALPGSPSSTVCSFWQKGSLSI